jgi:hypothetical protein
MPGILTETELNEVVQQIADDINGNPASISTLIGSYHFVRIATHQVPYEYAFNIVRYCEKYAWMETPSLLEKLLDKYRVIAKFNAIIVRIQQLTPPKFHIGMRPWDTILVQADDPFLSRSITRKAIECFSYALKPTINPPGIRVLVVKGPEQSGKTYTYNFIGYIHKCLGGLHFNSVWIDLKKHFTGSFGPMELMKLILDQVNPEWQEQQVYIPELGNEQAARWIQVLCGIIADQIEYTNTNHIIVIDGFDEKPGESLRIPHEVSEMIIQLTGFATGSNHSSRGNDMIRVVLLGFDQPVGNHFNRVRIDDIRPIQPTDLEEYLNYYAELHNKEMPEHWTAPLVTKVLQNDEPARKDRTKIISQRVLAIARQTIGT